MNDLIYSEDPHWIIISDGRQTEWVKKTDPMSQQLKECYESGQLNSEGYGGVLITRLLHSDDRFEYNWENKVLIYSDSDTKRTLPIWITKYLQSFREINSAELNVLILFLEKYAVYETEELDGQLNKLSDGWKEFIRISEKSKLIIKMFKACPHLHCIDEELDELIEEISYSNYIWNFGEGTHKSPICLISSLKDRVVSVKRLTSSNLRDSFTENFGLV